jgi:Tfp pilus assembly protein PilF
LRVFAEYSLPPVTRALALTLLIAGCATPPEPSSRADWPWDSKTKAVSTLMASAQSDASAGRLASAAASMERAIRLEPRNPRLWHELARVRLMQKEYGQAEHVALRSNSLSRGDSSLRTQNWNIIAQAREARGDADGARYARELAKRITY